MMIIASSKSTLPPSLSSCNDARLPMIFGQKGEDDPVNKAEILGVDYHDVTGTVIGVGYFTADAYRLARKEDGEKLYDASIYSHYAAIHIYPSGSQHDKLTTYFTIDFGEEAKFFNVAILKDPESRFASERNDWSLTDISGGDDSYDPNTEFFFATLAITGTGSPSQRQCRTSADHERL